MIAVEATRRPPKIDPAPAHRNPIVAMVLANLAQLSDAELDAIHVHTGWELQDRQENAASNH